MEKWERQAPGGEGGEDVDGRLSAVLVWPHLRKPQAEPEQLLVNRVSRHVS